MLLVGSRARGGVADRLPAAAQGGPAGGQAVYAVAPWASRGLAKLSGRLVPAAPGTEAEVLGRAGRRPRPRWPRPPQALRRAGRGHPGRRAAGSRARRADRGCCGWPTATGARLAWVPRRAGERGRGRGRRAAGPAARWPAGDRRRGPGRRRRRLGRRRGCPATPGRDTAGILAAAADGDLAGLVVGGVDPADLPDPQPPLQALDAVGFLVSLEVRASAVTERADVVLPVAPVSEKAGTFVDWEGRWRTFPAVLGSQRPARPPGAGRARRRDGRPARTARRRAVRGELGQLDAWEGTRVAAPTSPPAAAPQVGAGSRPCWPPGTCCSTRAGCRTASRTWPGPRTAAVARLSRRHGRGRSGSLTAARVDRHDGARVASPLPAGGHRDAGRRGLAADQLHRAAPVRAALGVDAGAVVTLSPGPIRGPRPAPTCGRAESITSPLLGAVREPPAGLPSRTRRLDFSQDNGWVVFGKALADLRLPGRGDADHDLGRASGRGPDAVPARVRTGSARSGCCRASPTA